MKGCNMSDMVLEFNELPSEVTLTVKVRVTRLLRFRIWAGSMLIRLAAAIMGVELVLEFEEQYDGCN